MFYTMVQFSTKIYIADNSGAKGAECIKVLGGHKKRVAKIGEKIVIAIKKSNSKLEKLKKGKVEKALVILTRKRFYRKNGFQLSYNNNLSIIINEDYMPIGNRILSVIPRELKKNKFSKIQSLTRTII